MNWALCDGLFGHVVSDTTSQWDGVPYRQVDILFAGDMHKTAFTDDEVSEITFLTQDEAVFEMAKVLNKLRAL